MRERDEVWQLLDEAAAEAERRRRILIRVCRTLLAAGVVIAAVGIVGAVW